MSTQLSFDEMKNHFLGSGTARIENTERWKPGKSRKYDNYGSIDASPILRPLFAAHAANLGAIQMAQVAKACSIPLWALLSEFNVKDNGYLYLGVEGEYQPLANFLGKALEALLLLEPGYQIGNDLSVDLVEMIHAAMVRCPEWVLPVVMLGHSEAGLSALAGKCFEKLRNHDDVTPWSDTTLERAANPESIIASIPEEANFSSAWLADLLTVSGVLEPYGLRNTTGVSSFWTRIIIELAQNELCEPLLDHPLLQDPKLMLAVLRSLDTELLILNGYDYEQIDLEDLGNSIDSLVSNLEKRRMGYLLDLVDVRLLIAKAALAVKQAHNDFEVINYPSSPDSLRQDGHPRNIFHSVFEGNFDVKVRMAGLAVEGVVEPKALMKAQLDIPVEEISMPQFMLWGFLARINLMTGDMDAALANQHLVHMAKACLSLKIPNYGVSRILSDNYSHLDSNMRVLTEYLEPMLDYSSLKSEDAEVRETLSLWGLNPKKIGITNSKALDWHIARDLGL